ncbi:MAG: CRTAC1 family protein, partial [Acidobacteriia bacterium]|nr:CRTAC1 family protein [Terriglobia bacterium]
DFKDVDNDGWDDIWHTAIEGESFPLFRNLGRNGEFAEITAAAGLGHETRNMSGWSNGVFDFDNDGWKDLFVARGNVQDNLALMSSRKAEEPNTVFRNLGKGKFADVSAEAGPGVQKPAAHRGAAFGDLDNDGRMDAVVTVLNGDVQYFHNLSPGGNHWILLKLVGVKSNGMGLGAQVRVTTPDGMKQCNHATTSTGYAASSDPRVHFGLGGSKRIAEIEIAWPSGIHQVLRDVAADQILTIQEK